MQGPRNHLLPGSALAADDDRNTRTCHRLQALELSCELCRKGRQPGSCALPVVDLGDGGSIRAGHPFAEDEETLSQLDQIAVRQRRSLDRNAVDERPVARLAVLDSPSAEHPVEPGVAGRDPQVRQLDGKAAAVGRDATFGTPSNGDLIDFCQRTAHAG